MTDKPSDSTPIFTYLDARTPLRAHEHMAIFHRGLASAVSWPGLVTEGLGLGDWCCYLAPAHLQREMLTGLRKFGVNVEHHLENRTLQFPPAGADSSRLVDWAQTLFADAERAHAPAVRWLEEGVRPGTETLPTSQSFEFHSRLNYLVKHYPSVALCQYDVEDLEISQLFSAIVVHRHLLVEGTLVRDNPFYIPVEKFLSMPSEERDRDLREVFRAVGLDVGKLLTTLAGYGQIQGVPSPRA